MVDSGPHPDCGNQRGMSRRSVPLRVVAVPAPPPVGAAPMPSYLQIEPVGQCNLRCRMCPVVYREEGAIGAGGNPPAFMPFDTYRRILDEFAGISELHLQGLGEPFLHPRFLAMVRYAAGKGIAVTTNTNLTALSERRAEECVRSGLRTLYVSLDAADAALYESIRVGSRFDRVLRNLDRVVDARRRLRSGTPHVGIVAVAMRRNLEQLPKLVRLAHAHGVGLVSVQHLAHDFSEGSLPERYAPMRAFVDGETLLDEDAARVEQWFAEARSVARSLGVELRLPRLDAAGRVGGRKGRARCDWPWRGAYVSYSGKAMPCCMVATPDRIHFGDMARDGVARVWNGPAYEAFRARLDSDDPPEICRGCAIYNGTF